jgi:hypothetical protein
MRPFATRTPSARKRRACSRDPLPLSCRTGHWRQLKGLPSLCVYPSGEKRMSMSG